MKMYSILKKLYIVHLQEVFYDLEKMDNDLKNNVTLYKKDIWNSILNLDYKLFRENRKKKYLFDYQIQTDGISCSLLFILKNTKGKKYGTRTPKAIKEENTLHIDCNLPRDLTITVRNL